MGIGTSLGAFYDDSFHHAAAQWDDKYDDNVIDPDRPMNHLEPLPKVPKFEETIPPELPSEPFLGNSPQSSLDSLTVPVDYKTASPLVTITDADINQAVNIGLAVSGGGLETKAVTAAEKIRSAALQYKDKTYEGANHGFALGDIMDKFGDVSMKDIKDGFTTTLGRFVSREEAFGLAKKQNQIEGKVLDSIPKDQDYNMLLSEDLVQY